MTLSATNTTTTKSPTISAIIVGHAAPIDNALDQINKQLIRPSEVVLVACCTDIVTEDVDIEVYNTHRDDFGHLARDIGLRLATKDYSWFVNCDDEYENDFTSKLLAQNVDFAYCDWDERGRIQESYPSLGTITSGNFIIRTQIAQKVGWNHREYIADGKFVMDVMEYPGLTHSHVAEVLYTHR